MSPRQMRASRTEDGMRVEAVVEIHEPLVPNPRGLSHRASGAWRLELARAPLLRGQLANRSLACEE
jgi:hypothetical protein